MNLDKHSESRNRAESPLVEWLKEKGVANGSVTLTHRAEIRRLERLDAHELSLFAAREKLNITRKPCGGYWITRRREFDGEPPYSAKRSGAGKSSGKWIAVLGVAILGGFVFLFQAI